MTKLRRTLLLGLTLATTAVAQSDANRVLPTPDVGSAQYGRSVASRASGLVVGDPGADAGVGAVYLFLRQGSPPYSRTKKLVAPDAVKHGGFGHAVVFDEPSVGFGHGWLVAGAPLAGAAAGAVVVYEYSDSDAWLPEVLVGSQRQAGDSFGTSVAVAGDVCVVGAPHADSDEGAVYVFRYSDAGGWAEEKRLTPPPGTTSELFGGDVALHEGTLVVGAAGHDASAGAVYLFAESAGSWTPDGNFEGSVFGGGGNFGVTVDLDGPRLAVGASARGAVYVFERGAAGWGQPDVIEAPQGLVNFGIGLALQGATLAVTGTGDPSQVLVYKRFQGAWTRDAAFSDPSPSTHLTSYGSAAVIDAVTHELVVGATADVGGEIAGDAYLQDTVTSVRGAIVPASISFTRGQKPGDPQTIVLKGAIDLGPTPPDLSLGGTLTIGKLALPVSGFEALPRGRGFHHRSKGLAMDVRMNVQGSSRATVSIQIVGDLGSAELDPDGIVTVAYVAPGLVAETSVTLAQGKYVARKTPLALHRPVLSVAEAEASPRGGRGLVVLRTRFATDGVGPSSGPDVRIAFNGTMFGVYERASPSDFEHVNGRWRMKKSPHSRVSSFVVDYAKGTITIVTKPDYMGPPSGQAPDLTTPENIYLDLDGISMRVDLRTGLRGKRSVY